MLYRLGLLAVRFRWPIILLWLALLALAVPFAPRATTVLKQGFGTSGTEAERGLELLTERLGIPEASLTVAFHSPTLTADDPAYARAVKQALADLEGLPEVARVITPFNSSNPRMVSADGHTVYALVFLNLTVDEALDRYQGLRGRIHSDQLDVWVTGGVAIFADIDRYSAQDLRRGETLAFPLVLVVLLLVFGSAVAAGLPVAVGAVSLALTLALVYFLGRQTDLSIFVLNIASFLGLGLAIDYSLLVVNRFREEMERHPVREAVAVTMDTAGSALLFSALTSILGMSGLLMFPYMMLRSLGVGGILVIFLSLMLAFTLMPALLSLLGPRVNAVALWRPRPPREGAGLWHRIALTVMRYPWPTIIPLGALLIATGLPFLQANIGEPWASILPPGAESRQGWELLARAFGEGELSPVLVLATAPQGVLRPEALGPLYDLAHRIADDPRVERVESIVTLDPRLGKKDYLALYSNPEAIPLPRVKEALQALGSKDTTLMRVFTRHPVLSEENKSLVKDIRRWAPSTGLQVYVTGATAQIMDAMEAMYSKFPWVVVYVLATIYLALLLLFRSVVLPLKAVVMNSLSIFASYGALVYIFQQGHFQGLLGFTAEGYTEATVPIILFSILFGLSMDYEVFLLTRVKEYYDAGADNTASVALGLEMTGRIITSAALILVLVAASFATGDIIIVKALGVGTAIAILLDATVVRALLVPALMRVLGDWNWWAPRFLRGRPSPRP